MKGKDIVWLFLALIFSGLIVILCKNNNDSNHLPTIGYRVYLEGKSIGYIESRDELDDYINVQQEKVKEKYNVDTIYIPNNIDIVKELTYDDNIDEVKDIYSKISSISPFTIKGYRVIIDRTNSTTYTNDDNNEEDKENIIKINVINKEIFTEAAESVILSFVDDEQYHDYVDNKKVSLDATGELIENIYIEDDIRIKEAYLPIDEVIFMDVDDLTKYLIFGKNESTGKYTVQNGDSIEKIADNNKMSVNEILIANSDIKAKTSLLYVGQEISIGAVSPVFNTIVEKHIVEDQTIKFETIYEYSNNLYQGQTETKQEGSNGVTRVTQKVKMINGEIAQAYITSSEELVPVVNKIVVRGGKQVRRGDGEWSWPTNFPYMISSGFGWRWGTLHRGVDIIGTGRGSPIYAARSGVVVTLGSYNPGLGYYVVIKHDNGYYTQYAHMQNTDGNDIAWRTGSATKYIVEGQRVEAHDVIGEVGSSGNSTGPHLHFEIWDGPPYQSNCYNPLLFY